MRLYHKLHKNPCPSKRAGLIRNIGKRVQGIIRKNPSTHRKIFEEIFAYKQELEGFHGLEVGVIGRSQTLDGGAGYLIEHPWFPANKKGEKRIAVRVCGRKKAAEIGAVSVNRLRSTLSKEAPVEYLIEEVVEFCCLAEEPQTPAPGNKYESGVLLCTGKGRHEGTRIGIGGRPEDTFVDLNKELMKLTTQELALLDVELGPGRVRPGPISKARKEFLESDPLGSQAPELERKWKGLSSRLFDIQSKKGKIEEELRRASVSRPLAVKEGSRKLGGRGLRLHGRALHEEEFLAGGGESTARGLAFRYGEEEAEKLGKVEREFKEDILMKTGGRLRRIGGGAKIPLNQRFIVGDSPLVGVIWDERVVDPLTGSAVGKRGEFLWQIYDKTGSMITSGVVKKSESGGGRSRAASLISQKSSDIMSETKRKRGSFKAAPISGYEASTIQEAIISKKTAPSLVLGEHLIAQFVPQDKLMKKGRGGNADWRDIMQWGFPTPYGLVEFHRDLSGYHVTLKLPSGTKHMATAIFDNMDDAVDYSMIMMQELTGIGKWLVTDGPRWSEKPARGRSRRLENPTKNPSLMELLAPPFLLRPKRKRVAVKPGEVKFDTEKRMEQLIRSSHGKDAFDLGFVFGVLRGIDTCGMTRVVERRRIRRHVEQQVLDAVYALAVEAPSQGNPKKNPKKNPEEFVEMAKDILTPPGLDRPKRKRKPVTVHELPDLKGHFTDLAWALDGQAGFDFGFVFGVLRGIDTCGMANLLDRRRVRRELEGSVIGMLGGGVG